MATPSIPSFPPIRVEDLNGWRSIELRYLGHSVEGDDEFYMITVGGSYRDRNVAVNLLLPCRWKEMDQPLGSGHLQFKGNVVFVNAQPLERDTLRALAEIYEVPDPAAGMANFTDTIAVALTGDPHDVLSSPVSLKVFFGSFPDSQLEYAELFVNVDVPSGFVRLEEKDPEYRRAIIAALATGDSWPEDVDELGAA